MTNPSLIAIAALLLLNLLAAAHLPRSWTYPPILLAAVWGATLVVYALHGEGLYPLGGETALAIVLGVGAFSLGGWGALSAADPVPGPPGGPSLEKRSGRWIIWVCAGGLPFFARQILAAGADGVTGNLLVDARFVAIEDAMQGRSGPLAYLVPLVVFGTALHVLRIVRTTRLQTAAMVVLCVAYIVLTAGRFFFLVLFAIVAGGAAVQGRARASTVLLVGGGAFLAVFGAMAYLLDKGVDDTGDVLAQTLETFSVYLVSGVAGLNDYLRDGAVARTWGQNTFRLLIALASALGAHVSPRPLIMEFRWVPIQTNVYTIFRNYLEDFGWAGVVAIEAAFGFLHTVFWVRARQGLESAAFLYGVMLFCLIMQVFQDNYLNSLSLWGQGAILLWLLSPRPRQPPGGEASPLAEPGPAAAR